MSGGSLYAMPKNLVLAASAGTGKTHALVGVVLHLFVTDRKGKKPIDPSRVVATTFSRKAAAEIRSRVATELERLAFAPETSVYVASISTAGDKVLSGTDIQRRARRAMGRLPHARFGTLHSFATGIVRQYAVELGLGPGFDLATEADARARAEDAIAGAIERRLATQGDAIRMLAEAAGGIEPLIGQLRRVLGQLEEDGRSARDLALASDDPTDLERAAAAFVEHARALSMTPKFDLAAREVVHAWTAKDPKRFEEAAAALGGIAVRGKKSPEVESFAVFRSTLAGQTNEERARRLARSWRARASFAVGATLVRDVLAEAETEIERIGRARATLGFGEILRSARALLRERPDVAEEISSGLDALLVDEFQDTSRVQRDLLQLLWARPSAREGGRVPPLSTIRKEGLLVVGDRKQSIYGFRGADVGVFAELAVGLAGRPAREALGIPAGVTWEPKEPLADFHALRENRRSVAPILSFANAFSATRFRPGEPPPPSLFEIEYVPRTEDLLVPNEARTAESQETTGGLQASLEKSLGLTSAGARRTTWLRIAPKGASSTHLDEALVISERIGELARESGVGWRDIAVLATTNGMLDAVAFALAQAGIPYVVSGKSFYRTREVRDLRAMLALVLDPHDRLSALEVLRGPWAAVHDETLLGLLRPEGLPPPEGWTSPLRPELVRSSDRASVAATADLVLALAKVAGRLSPGTILREAVEARGLREVLGAMPRGEQRVANMEKLLATADRHADARAFRSWLDEATAQEITESEAATFSEEDDAVRLLTVHASKGLDFPIVFIPEIGATLPRTEKGAVRVALGAADAPNVLSVRIADEGGLVLEPPSFARAYATARRRERAERQRLAYVAVTRAARAMFLVGGRKQKSETTQDPGTSTLAALEELKDHPSLAIEDVEVPAPSMQRDDAPATGALPKDEATATKKPSVPSWRALPIAPTALADFDHCSRRFELIHLLGLPEHVRGQKSGGKSGALDARAQGTLAHAVLERLPVAAFANDGAAHASRALGCEGVATDHPQHDAIVARVVRFLDSAYARSIAERGAKLEREVPFVLDIPGTHDGADDPRHVILRGSMDLVVVWPDGAIDVVDYKSARAPVDRDTVSAGYAFQLDVYALAARAMFHGQTSAQLRAGLVFLGGGSGEPIWRTLPSEAGLRARLASLGNDLVEARWRDHFPRVALDRCEAIHCGFIGRCHGELERAHAGETDVNPPRATTT